MDNQDQTRTHTPGHGNHGVHLCHKCGWPFPNPHPSAKHRRSHKKICGTIEGYKLLDPEGFSHSNASDNERLSDDDHKTPNIRQLTVKSSDDLQIQNLEVLQSEPDLVGNTLDIKGQPPDSTVDPVGSSVSDLRTKDSTVGQCDDGFGLQSDSHPSKAEAMSDAPEENKVYTGEKVTDYSLTSVVSSDDIVSEASDIVPKVEDSNAVTSDGVADGAVKKKEEDSIKFFPEVSQYDLPLEIDSAVNTIVTTNDSQVKSAPVLEDGTSTDLLKILQEKGERNFDVNTHLMPDDKPGVAHLESEFEDFKDHDRVVVQNPLILKSSQALKHEEGDLKETTTEENYSDFNSRQLPEETKVLSPDVHVVNDTIKQEQVNCEPVAEEMLAEEQSEVSSVKLTDDVFKRSDEIGCSVDAIQSEMESHMYHFSGVQDSDNPEKSQQLDLPEDSLIGPSDEYEDFKDQEQVPLQDPSSLLSSEALRHEDNGLKDANSGENHSGFDATQLSVESEILAPVMYGLDNTIKQEQGDCEPVGKQAEVLPVQLTVDNKQGSDEIGVSADVTKPDVYDSCAVNIPGEQESNDDLKSSKQVNLSEGTVAAPTDESPGDAPFDSATYQPTSVISMDATSQSEENGTEIDADGNGMLGGTNEEGDVAIRTLKPCNLLQFEVKSSSDVFEDDAVDERGKSGKWNVTDAQCGEGLIMTGNSLPKSGRSHFESPISSEDVMDGSARKLTAVECTDIDALLVTKDDVKDDKNSCSKLQEEHVSNLSDLHQSRDTELLVKAPENQPKEDPSLPPFNTEHSVRNGSDLEDNQVRAPAGEASGNCAAPAQDQSGNNLVEQQLSSSRIDASVYSGSRCDSLEGNWGSVSVLSVQSDAPAVIDVETLPSTDLPASTESTGSNLNNPKAPSMGQQYEKSEMFEPPSFMTLVESGHAVGPKDAASEVQTDQNPQHPSSNPSQAGWFPTLTPVVNESEGRKRNEEIIAKVTNWSTIKQHIPLKSLLGEAAQSNNQKSPKQEGNQVHQKNQNISKDNGSGLTTVNSILGPESPAAQIAKVEAGEEWNSPARYPVGIKREKRKVKSRPYWMQFVCCSTVDPQHS